MPMTIIVTRDVESRYRGFLTSVMLEVSPGVYVSPNLSSGVRTRIWKVIDDWFAILRRGSIVMIWRDNTKSGGLGLSHLGDPPKEIFDSDGILLLKRL